MKSVKMMIASITLILATASVSAFAEDIPTVDTHPGHGGYTVPTQQLAQDQVSPLTGTNSDGVDTAPGH